MKRIGILLSLAFATISIAAGTITVVPGSDAVYEAISQAQAGDVLVLAEGEYQEANKLTIDKQLTIQAAEGAQPIIRMASRIETSASLTLQSIELIANSTGEAIRLVPGSEPYTVAIKSCTLQGFTSKTIRVYATDQEAAYVDSLVIDDCVVKPSAGRGLEASVANKQVNHLLIRNSTFDGGATGVG